MLGYSVSLADEITRWMDSVANSLTDVANCITHARNSLNMTGKTGDAIEVNLDSLGKAILQHTDNIGILTSARRTVAEGARTAVSHANEVKNESNSIGFSHGGLTIENDRKNQLAQKKNHLKQFCKNRFKRFMIQHLDLSAILMQEARHFFLDLS